MDKFSLSAEALCRGASEAAPSLGTPEDMIRKSPDTGNSLHGVPCPCEWNLVCGRGSYTAEFDG